MINTKFGEDSPTEHQDAEGTEDDPLAPGDYDNVCAPCNYGKGRRDSVLKTSDIIRRGD